MVPLVEFWETVDHGDLVCGLAELHCSFWTYASHFMKFARPYIHDDFLCGLPLQGKL